MPEIDLYDMQGTKKGTLSVSEGVFDVNVSSALIHQAVVRHLANARMGTHSTKTRGEVRGGGRKPWRQKGTGRSRHGSNRSPIWRGGGITFGPKPRDYTQDMPRKMRRQALRGVLTSKVREGKMIALESLQFEVPKTRGFIEMMSALKLPTNTLFVISGSNVAVEKSASNLQGVKVLIPDAMNVHEILKYDRLVMTRDAISRVEEVLA
jgi:large subunit ribosomal protein L4